MARQTEKRHEENLVIHHILQEEEKIAALDREITRQKKQIKQIENSNTWKLGKKFRRLRDFFNRLFHRKDAVEKQEQITALQQQLQQSETELMHVKEELQIRALEDELSTTEAIKRQVRDMKDQGTLIPTLDRIIAMKQGNQANLTTALTHAARLYMNHDTTYRNHVYEKIMQAIPLEEIPEFMIRAGIGEPSIPLHQVASFRGSLNMRMRKMQIQKTLPEWELDDKQKAYQFAKALNVPVPYVDEQTYPYQDIPVQEGVVIKPKDGAGGRGVYLVHCTDEIIDVKKSIKLTSWDTLMESIAKDLATGQVDRDEWLIESLIYEKNTEKTPARDVKFYCFYGKIGLVLEIIRYPEVRHTWWMSDGKRVKVGKYDESLFAGTAFTEEERVTVEKMSAEIPAPFVRIDFLRGEEGLVFGEFTPKPGNYDEFDQTTDQQLGDLFLEAEERLVADLLAGKTFTAYQNYIKEHVHG